MKNAGPDKSAVDKVVEGASLAAGVCKIAAYRAYKKVFGVTDAPPREIMEVLALGLGGTGKTSLWTCASGESLDEVEETQGFTIKAVALPGTVLNIKELGGNEVIRPYWNRYYDSEVDGLLFVVDAAGDEGHLSESKRELQAALKHKNLRELPLLVLASKQDVSGARSAQEIATALGVDVCDGGEGQPMRAVVAVSARSSTAEALQTVLMTMVKAVQEEDARYRAAEAKTEAETEAEAKGRKE